MLYGGDDLSALVIDIGHNSLRVGYCQEDTPRAEIPAIVGTLDEAAPVPSTSQNGANEIHDKKDSLLSTSEKKYFLDTTYLHVPRKGMEVISYMKDGMIEDWDLFEKMLDYTYAKCMRTKSVDHPVLISEASWNVGMKREKLTELMFEKYNVPAFFLIKNAVLAAFANGRSTGIVVDSGATHTSVVPVHNGFALTRAIVKSPLGGDYITMLCENFLQQESDIEIVPPYLIGAKEAVKEKERALWTRKQNIPEVTSSWHNYMTKKVVQDFQATVLKVYKSPYDEKAVSRIPPVSYEFPNGYHQRFGSKRFLIPEAIFNPSIVPMQSEMVGDTILGVGQIVTTSIGMCDIDERPSLYRSVVVTGGNSCLQGFPERLNRDLSVRVPSRMKLKMLSANGSVERRFGAWIGGSIVASLGSLQQVWISNQEYQEGGKGVVIQKCP